MWLEAVLCATGVSTSMVMHMACPQCAEWSRLLPLTTAYGALSATVLPSEFGRDAALFFAGVEFAGIHAALGLPVIVAACAHAVYGAWNTHLVHGGTRGVASATVGCVVLYFVLKILGADRDLLFVPVFLAFGCALWLWAVWARRGHSAFKVFVLLALVAHVVEMALYLVPHPPLSPLVVHLAPLLVSLGPTCFVVLRWRATR